MARAQDAPGLLSLRESVPGRRDTKRIRGNRSASLWRLLICALPGDLAAASMEEVEVQWRASAEELEERRRASAEGLGGARAGPHGARTCLARKLAGDMRAPTEPRRGRGGGGE